MLSIDTAKQFRDLLVILLAKDSSRKDIEEHIKVIDAFLANPNPIGELPDEVKKIISDLYFEHASN